MSYEEVIQNHEMHHASIASIHMAHDNPAQIVTGNRGVDYVLDGLRAKGISESEIASLLSRISDSVNLEVSQ